MLMVMAPIYKKVGTHVYEVLSLIQKQGWNPYRSRVDTQIETEYSHSITWLEFTITSQSGDTSMPPPSHPPVSRQQVICCGHQ